jgi:hypothetical protein
MPATSSSVGVGGLIELHLAVGDVPEKVGSFGGGGGVA